MPVTLGTSSVRLAGFSANGESVWTYDGDSWQYWSAKTGKALGVPIAIPNDQTVFALAHGLLAACVQPTREQPGSRVVIYDMETGQRQTIPLNSGLLLGKFSPDRKLIVLVRLNRFVEVWDIQGKRLNRRYQNGVINDLSFSDDSKLLILGSSAGLLGRVAE